jgi:hypothetical protein
MTRTLAGQERIPVTYTSALRSSVFVHCCKEGYRFVGTNPAGNDAFFLREDYAGRFADDSLQFVRSLPSRFRESGNASGRRTYLRGLEKLNQISSSPVINVETGSIIRLGDLETVYSDEWLLAMIWKSAAS